uniref:Phosphomannomutase n=1 Tax=Cyamopsis tetragonoloba TaxID=3832 RepID=A0A678NZB7_CYATE|nr:phosphomannomutase [Cyamopsis tetragonoloba]APU87394.1 phosphomannomutase [Cyamopsis tetragonoloba]
MVISTLVSFVTKEVDFIEIIKVSQAVSFIPTLRKNIKAYLSSNGKC